MYTRLFLVKKKYLVMVSLVFILALSIVASGFALSTMNLIINSTGTISPNLARVLHVQGRYIKNDLNQTVRLRGVEKGISFLDDPGAGWMGSYGWNPTLVAQELDIMKTWGVNIVRIIEANANWKLNLKDATGKYNHRDIVLQLAQLLAERGMYLMISGYADVPNGYTGGGDGQVPLPYPPYNNRPDIITSVQDWINIYSNMANSLKSQPNVILETHNEPSEGTESSWFSNFQLCLNAIRATGFTGLVVVQWDFGTWVNLDYPPPENPASTLDWVENYSINDPTGNLVYSTHQYRFHHQIGQFSEGGYIDAYTYADIKQAFIYEKLYYVINNLTKPLLIGECGANHYWTGIDYTREMTAWDNQLKLYDEMGLNYIGWWWRAAYPYDLITDDGSPGVPTAPGQILKDHLQLPP